MAITKTTAIERCEVYPASDSTAANTLNAAWPSLMVCYKDTIDDPDDADLPVIASRTKHFNKFTLTESIPEGESEPVVSSAATDVSGEPQLVRDICGAIWS